MKLTPAELLAGEQLLFSKNANLLIHPSDYGMIRLLGVDREALGGKLHLTNYRLVFASHGVNRVVGQMSIFLPEILEVSDESRGAVKRLRVKTETQKTDFIVWGIPSLIEQIEQARAGLSTGDMQIISEQLAARPETLGDGMI
jgi:hypothetical protein